MIHRSGLVQMLKSSAHVNCEPANCESSSRGDTVNSMQVSCIKGSLKAKDCSKGEGVKEGNPSAISCLS